MEIKHRGWVNGCPTVAYLEMKVRSGGVTGVPSESYGLTGSYCFTGSGHGGLQMCVACLHSIIVDHHDIMTISPLIIAYTSYYARKCRPYSVANT